MKQHTKVYFKAFGYDLGDAGQFIPSELSGSKAVDLHHIVNRENRIENLIALTRQEHLDYGEIKDKTYYLLITHRAVLDKYGIEYDDAWFEIHLERYK